MLCYKDKSYCSLSDDCNKQCDIRLTNSELIQAQQSVFPIGYIMPTCDRLKQPKKEVINGK